MAERVLLLGTSNAGKRRELDILLADTEWTVKSLNDYPSIAPPVEDAATFEDNALIKARYYSAAYSVATIADDSGLEVQALDGAPGVHSARYAGADATDADNNSKLLKDLSGISDRRARFVCCAAYVKLDGEEHLERGTVSGQILAAPQGGTGFGYDPLFQPEGEMRSFAEMTREEKNAISHRGRAFSKLAAYLRTLNE